MSIGTGSPEPPGFAAATRFWLKLGCIGFGGPAGQIAIMHSELVERRRWISEGRFMHALNYCMLLPGPEAQQLATYLGWLMHRSLGGIVAGALFVLPSLILLMVLSWIYLRFGQLPAVAGVLAGIKPAVIALVIQAALRIGGRSLHSPALWLIAITALLMMSVLKVSFPWILAGAALFGWWGSRHAPDQFRVSRPAHGRAPRDAPQNPGEAGPDTPALIDDHSPLPAHARHSGPRMLRVLLIGLGLWALSFLALLAWLGWHNPLPQMAWFFSKAALVTFGGAYAVLPYVCEAAVEQFQWLSALQMMDGLALGESTPGPLIMIVSFIAFVGGWQQQVLGPDMILAGAALAALVVTWFTFLPSFVFILAGGPLVEASKDQARFTAPMVAISAAVVGVITQLALYFAWHVLWPQGWTGAFNWAAAMITLATMVALQRFRLGVVTVLSAAGTCGLLLQLSS